MTKTDFFNTLAKILPLPFDPEEVETVEENCGTVWITLKDGKVYYLVVGGCEE